MSDDQSWVVMTHPALPTPIRVAASAAPIHEASGWTVADEPELKGMTDEEFITRFGYDPNP